MGQNKEECHSAYCTASLNTTLTDKLLHPVETTCTIWSSIQKTTHFAHTIYLYVSWDSINYSSWNCWLSALCSEDGLSSLWGKKELITQNLDEKQYAD